MSIYAISDLHLSLGTDKPMDVFGDKWKNYTEKLCKNWQAVVRPSDTVLLPGDISWATYMEDAYQDFSYINQLNGRKVILKGNHDYWWGTLTKMEQFLVENRFDSIQFLHNKALMLDDLAVCGTRGWTIAGDGAKEEDVRFFEREKQRLVLSLEDAKRQGAEQIIVAMHYPPMERNNSNKDFLDIMREYGVRECYYGHLHAAAQNFAVQGNVEGVVLHLVSCDYLGFTPLLIR